MAHSLPLNQMTVEEKIRAMESLWDDLCRRARALESPSWHGEVLAARENAIGSGEDVSEDWEEAKRKIANELR